jgi:hypothetical protein
VAGKLQELSKRVGSVLVVIDHQHDAATSCRYFRRSHAQTL